MMAEREALEAPVELTPGHAFGLCPDTAAPGDVGGCCKGIDGRGGAAAAMVEALGS